MTNGRANSDSPAREIDQQLLAYLTDRLPTETSLDVDTNLIETDLLDSLLIMDLVAFTEATFDVRLDNQDIAPRHFRSVRTLAELIRERGA